MKFRFFQLFTVLFLFSCGGKGYKTAIDIAINVDPAQVSFSDVKLGSKDERMLIIKHVGSEGEITIKKVYFDENSSKDFTCTQPEKTTLLPGESTTMKIIYHPSDPLKDDGTLVIEHNVPPLEKTEVPVSALMQLPDLTVYPNPVDFGEVKNADKKNLEVIIQNSGSDKFQINKIYLSEKTSNDFFIESIAQLLPFELAPDAKLGLTMSYAPSKGGSDSGFLMIEAETAVIKNIKSETQIKGKEIGPKILCLDKVDFEWVPLNEKKEKELTITNDGTDELIITSIKIGPQPVTDISYGVFSEEVNLPLSLKAGDFYNLKLYWQPDKVYEPSDLPIATVTLSSNDANEPDVSVPVYGKVDVPFLEVTPPDIVDFGFVSPTVIGMREVVLTNVGHADIVVNSITLTENPTSEFSIIVDESFPPVSSQPSAGSIPSNNFVTVKLNFINKGGTEGEIIKGKAEIKSNAYQKETIVLSLIAQRGGAPTCIPQIVPSVVNFGGVIQGEELVKEVKIQNAGTGYCSVQNCAAYSCPTLLSFNAICNDTSFSKDYEIVAGTAPPTIKDGLGPGGSHTMQVKFKSPKGEFWSPDVVGSLRCTVWDDYQKKSVVTPPKTSGLFGEGYPGNLMAKIGYVNIVVIPKTVDFGKQGIGCMSPKHTITIMNTGNAAMTVKDISFFQCTPEFKWMTTIPPLPMKISDSSKFTFDVAYSPQDLGSDKCYIRIESNDPDEPVIYVTLLGETVTGKTVEENFKQVSGDKYDLLFVLDNCACTIMDWGMEISESLSNFCDNGAIWDKDFHIGLINVNIDDKSIKGKFNAGDKSMQPRFVETSTPNASSKLQEFFDKFQEEQVNDAKTKGGILASYLAITEPLSKNTGIACSTDQDCFNTASICPDPANCPYECVDGICGGYNRDFYREDAYLDIVYISKGDDASPGKLSDYIDLLKSVKGFTNVDITHAHAALWEPNICEMKHAGNVEGLRYKELVAAFSGDVSPICSDFSPMLNKIGSGAGALTYQFFLSGTPDSSTIKVYVKGKQCSSGWNYDAASNSIIFSKNSSCTPQYGDDIKVTYEIQCNK